jgi:hypothetical protein
VVQVGRGSLDVVWDAIYARGFDDFDLCDQLAETAMHYEARYGEELEAAVEQAIARKQVEPRGFWCPACKSGAGWEYGTPTCTTCGELLRGT